jgi:uncharacterized membrane protein
MFDWQYAWCARDTGIWFGFLTGAVLYKLGFVRPLTFILLLLFCIPIALDGGIQTFSTLISIGSDIHGSEGYHSNNLLRFLTGAFFGLGLSLYLSQYIITPKKNTEKFALYKIVILSLCVLSLIYFVLIGIWDITSKETKPTNSLDSTPKIQEGFFFERRRDGECPTDIATGPLNLDCFF